MSPRSRALGLAGSATGVVLPSSRTSAFHSRTSSSPSPQVLESDFLLVIICSTRKEMPIGEIYHPDRRDPSWGRLPRNLHLLHPGCGRVAMGAGPGAAGIGPPEPDRLARPAGRGRSAGRTSVAVGGRSVGRSVAVGRSRTVAVVGRAVAGVAVGRASVRVPYLIPFAILAHPRKVITYGVRVITYGVRPYLITLITYGGHAGRGQSPGDHGARPEAGPLGLYAQLRAGPTEGDLGDILVLRFPPEVSGRPGPLG